MKLRLIRRRLDHTSASFDKLNNTKQTT